jgi:hypothetical protein
MITRPNEDFIRNHRVVFVTNAMGSVTCLMKCQIPQRAINLWSGDSIVLDIESFINYSNSEEYQSNDIIIFSKVIPYFREDVFNCLDNIKNKVKCIFSEASEESSFEVFSVEGEEYHSIHLDNKEKLEKFATYLDGFLYESEKLKDRINTYFPDMTCLQVRHIHSNCHNALNPLSPMGAKDTELNYENLLNQYYKPDIVKNFSKIGYLGRPKYCTDFLSLARTTYELSHMVGKTLGFYTSNPGIHDNIYETLNVDFAFSFIEENLNTQHYFDYKTANKVTALWSLGIPGLFSPLPTYKRVFEENNLEFERWSMPEKEVIYDSKGTVNEHETSLKYGSKVAEKIFTRISDSTFEDERKDLFTISKRYNPMNVFWLYEDVFNFCEGLEK